MGASAAAMRAHYSKNGHHRSGHTKENDASIARAGTKISEKLKAHYSTHAHWTAGLTNETCDIIAKRSQKISVALAGKPLSEEHKLALRAAKTLSEHDVRKRLSELNFTLESTYAHSMQPIQLRCTICSNECTKTLHATVYGSKCPTCHPPWASKTSVWQQEIFDFVVSICPDARLNDREHLGGLEIDIFVPSKSFGIECNGLYWHSDAAGRFKPDHCERKRISALERGTMLFFVFEDEWRDKRSIIESMIRHRLGASPRKLCARKLKLERCVPADVRDFINENHIDGNVRCSSAFRLTTAEGETVGVCTLRVATHGKIAGQLEVARMCFLHNTCVAGGVSRLISACKRLAREISSSMLISYADNRFGGSCYVGFMDVDATTVIRFWWTDHQVRTDRFAVRADNANGLSERDVAAQRGVSRIYCCSNTRYSVKVSP